MAKCLKGKSEVGEGEARFVCKKCGALTDIKGHVCAPESIGGDEADSGGEDKAVRKREKAAEKLRKAEKEYARLLASTEKALEKARRKVKKAKEKLAAFKAGG